MLFHGKLKGHQLQRLMTMARATDFGILPCNKSMYSAKISAPLL
jgi:hypothetical protein